MLNVSSFVFPVQCCQILFQLSEKCVWWHVSVLSMAAAPPVAPHLPPVPLLLVRDSGLIVLWVEHLVPYTTAHIPHPSIHPPVPGPCCWGYAAVFTSGHQVFILWKRRWVKDFTCSPFRPPCVNQTPHTSFCLCPPLHPSWLPTRNPGEYYFPTGFPPWSCLCYTLASSPYFFSTSPDFL